MMPNPGHLPAECIVLADDGRPTGRIRRVAVILRNGTVHGREAVNTDSKLGWDAETTRWTLTGHAYDVVEFEPYL